MIQNKNVDWLTRAFYQFIVLPVLMIAGFLISVVMIIISPLILLIGLGAFKLWMRRVNKQAQSWQQTHTRHVKSYTVETVVHPDQAAIPPQLPHQKSDNSE